MTSSSTLAILGLLTLVAAPSGAQSEERLALVRGDPVQVQLPRDTTWHEADIVEVGSCAMVALATERSDSGFFAKPFGGVAALRQMDREGRWHGLGATQLRELRGCTPGMPREAAVPAECGTRSDLARRHTLDMLAGIRHRGATGNPTDELIGVAEVELEPVTNVALCHDLLRKVAQIVPDAMSVPFEGIIQVGGAGYIVSRSPLVDDPDSDGWITTVYLDTELMVRVSIETKIGAIAR